MLVHFFVLPSLVALSLALPLTKRGFSGTATFYDAGLGNCGTTVSPNAMVVALNTAQYGSTSSVSSHCFKTVTITNLKNGKTMNAMVQDSCPTCRYGDLDMSTALFSALNNGNMDDGVFPISWSFAGQGGGNSGGNSNQNKPKPKPKTTSTPSPARTSQAPAQAPAPSSSTPVAAPAPTAAAESIAQPPPPSFLAPTNTTLVNGTVSGTPAWWQVLDASCWQTNITLPANVTGAVISPSKFANTTADLSAQCGKWLNATNPDNGKSVLALIVSYIPGGTENQIALSDGYKALANMTDDMPAAIANVEWGIIAGNATVPDVEIAAALTVPVA